MRKIEKIIIHCSASDAYLKNTREIKAFHAGSPNELFQIAPDKRLRGRGWSDIGYHYVIPKDGKVELGRPLKRIGAHCVGQNSRSIGICLPGLKSFSIKQFHALEDLLIALSEWCPDATLHGHCEFDRNKTCPVFNLKRFKEFWDIITEI